MPVYAQKRGWMAKIRRGGPENVSLTLFAFDFGPCQRHFMKFYTFDTKLKVCLPTSEWLHTSPHPRLLLRLNVNRWRYTNRLKCYPSLGSEVEIDFAYLAAFRGAWPD